MSTRVNATILAAINTLLDDALTDVTEMSLHTDDPSADGSANELDADTAPGYERQPVSFAAAADGAKVTDDDVDFLADDDWPEVTHFALWDSGGSVLVSAPLAAPRQVGDGATLRFLTGQISVTAGDLEV